MAPRLSIRKIRAALETRKLFAEGRDDKYFLDHLKKLYQLRDNGVVLTIEAGTGGSPIDTVKGALKSSAQHAVFDGDRPELSEAVALAVASDLEHTVIMPNLDSMLLDIKGHKKVSASRAKSVFESNYMTDKERRSPAHYDRVFLKSELDEARTRIKTLDELITIIEAGSSGDSAVL